MQHVMKANGEYEDWSMVGQLIPKERRSLAMQKEQGTFLTSVTDCRGPKTTIKDLGLVILNLIFDPMNYDP